MRDTARNFQWPLIDRWLGATDNRTISQIDDGTLSHQSGVVTPKNNPTRESRYDQHTRGDRHNHSRPTLAMVRLKPHEIPVAGAAGGQVV